MTQANFEEAHLWVDDSDLERPVEVNPIDSQGESPRAVAVVAAVGFLCAQVSSWSVTAGALALVGAGAVAISRSTRIAFPLLLVLQFFSVGPALPPMFRLGVEGLLFGWGLLSGLGIAMRGDRLSALALLGLLIVGIWLALIAHPNVPSLAVGMVGFRKSAAIFIFVLIGFGLRRSTRDHIRTVIVLTLVGLSAFSLALHLLQPQVEAQVHRAAGSSTAYFAGQLRLQGLLSGPFHAALMGVTLALYGVVRFMWRRRSADLFIGLLGVAVLQQTQVRSAMVAMGAGLLLLPLAASVRGGSSGGRTLSAVRRLAPFAFLAIAALLFVVGDEATTSIGDAGSDTRLAGRWVTWTSALDLFGRSPVIGWGSGSAGDTLGPQFAGLEYVTSHNAVLKYAVEGGLIGLTLVSLFLVALGRIAWKSGALRDPACFGPAIAVSFFVMGLTGAILEANPVAPLLAMVLSAEIARGVSN